MDFYIVQPGDTVDRIASYYGIKVAQLIYIMEEKGYSGVDIDFEYILASDRDKFTAFVQLVADTMRAKGYRTSVAVAPIHQVRRVVEYAVTEIPPDKIDLGIPNYGYDWPLPFEKGVTRATTVGNVQVVRIAVREGAVIQFDTLAQSPFFSYTMDDGMEHEVWFEDVRSLQAKFDLVKEFGLRGCGYWQIMQWFRANWLLLYENFYIFK